MLGMPLSERKSPGPGTFPSAVLRRLATFPSAVLRRLATFPSATSESNLRSLADPPVASTRPSESRPNTSRRSIVGASRPCIRRSGSQALSGAQAGVCRRRSRLGDTEALSRRASGEAGGKDDRHDRAPARQGPEVDAGVQLPKPTASRRVNAMSSCATARHLAQ